MNKYHILILVLLIIGIFTIPIIKKKINGVSFREQFKNSITYKVIAISAVSIIVIWVIVVIITSFLLTRV